MENRGKTEKRPDMAVLVVSFGTSYNDAREKTIDVMEREIKEAFPDCLVCRAWTSKMIISKLKKRDNMEIFTVAGAMEHLREKGVSRLVVQPTHIINGIENDLMKEDVLKYRDQFTAITFGDPLLSSNEDNVEAIEALMKEYGKLPSQEALVFMGHGTEHYVNTTYAALDYTFKDLGYENVHMGTVESYPSIENVINKVRVTNPSKVVLAPFMFVAGDHARNDMSGDDEDSWKSQFEKEGFQVQCVIKGLGEYPQIRGLFMKHLLKAMEECEKISRSEAAQ